MHGHRVEEDDLDVEQDEQHRDQVEADPEAEGPRDLGGQAALVGLASWPGCRRLARSLAPITWLSAVNAPSDDQAESAEDEDREGSSGATRGLPYGRLCGYFAYIVDIPHQ